MGKFEENGEVVVVVIVVILVVVSCLVTLTKYCHYYYYGQWPVHVCVCVYLVAYNFWLLARKSK